MGGADIGRHGREWAACQYAVATQALAHGRQSPHSDFYLGWSTIDKDMLDLLEARVPLKDCLPIISDRSVQTDAMQWWRVGRAAKGPLVGENEHIDRVGMLSECHLQIAGTKVWRLRAPVECSDTCPGFETFVRVAPGEMLCLSIDRFRHQTYLAAGTSMNVDVAYDITGLASQQPVGAEQPPSTGQERPPSWAHEPQAVEPSSRSTATAEQTCRASDGSAGACTPSASPPATPLASVLLTSPSASVLDSTAKRGLLGRPWEHAASLAIPTSGNGATLFVHFVSSGASPAPPPVVVKRVHDALDAASLLLSTSLCRSVDDSLHLTHLDGALLDLRHGSGAALSNAVLTLAKHSGAHLSAAVKKIFGNGQTHVWLMESQELVRLEPESALAVSSVPLSLGALLAIDVVLNNWDRGLLGDDSTLPSWTSMPMDFADIECMLSKIHDPSFELPHESVSVSALDKQTAKKHVDLFLAKGALVTLDTELKRAHLSCEVTDDDFLAECKSAFIDMLSSRALAHPPASGAAPHLAQPSTLIRHVGEVLSAYDAAHFGHPELLKIEGAMVEALDVLATLDSESLFVRAAEGAAQEGSLLEGTMSAHWKNLMVRTQGVLDIWKGLRTNDRVAM
uniref:Uncharacterized protein n=1 Tax=Haptolina brevifila TaxID=156173 RepID=A0A7S2IAB4_9EUKA